MNIFRLIFGLPMAALVTAGLFALMAGVIGKPAMSPGTSTTKIDPITYQPPPDNIIATIEHKPVPKAPPPPDTTWKEPKSTPGGGGGGFSGPKSIPGEGEFNYKVIGSGPTIRVAPQYPSGCQSKGAEGTVIVQFDVTPEGNVVNPRIVDSANRCFDRTVLRTVARWKYAPDTSSGKATMRRGVVETFVFTLEE